MGQQGPLLSVGYGSCLHASASRAHRTGRPVRTGPDTPGTAGAWALHQGASPPIPPTTAAKLQPVAVNFLPSIMNGYRALIFQSVFCQVWRGGNRCAVAVRSAATPAPRRRAGAGA